MKPSVRKASAADAAELAKLSDQLGYPTSAAEMRRRLMGLSKRSGEQVIVAANNGRAVGWLHVGRREPLGDPDYAEICGLVVDEACRGQGIGQMLVRASERWAAKRGLKRMRVRSNVVRKRTHLFYENLGYAVTKKQTIFDKNLSR